MTALPHRESFTGDQPNAFHLATILPEDAYSYEPDVLDLPFWQTVAWHKTTSSYEIIAELLTAPPTCPRCNNPPEALHLNGTLVQSVIDEQLHNRLVRIHFVRQRYLCPCGRSLLQPLAGTVEGRAITERAAIHLARQAIVNSFEFVAATEGISPKMVKELFADFISRLDAARMIEFPEVLGIDGVCVGRRKNKRSYCLLTDISNHYVLELLGKTTEIELVRFLKQLPKPENLKVIVIDMSKGFLCVIQKLFPYVPVVIDPYHVLRMLNDAITSVVRTKQMHLSRAEHDELMRGGNRFLLLKRRFELTKDEKDQLALWFERVPQFKRAYDLKEEVYDLWRCTERHDAEALYEAWLKKVPADLDRHFSKFTGAIRRWRPHIFNYFEHKFTNAYTESKNRDIKTLHRQGRRTSFSVLRAKLLYADILLRPPQISSGIPPRHIRRAIKDAREKQRSVHLRAPRSYIARLEATRKSRNEFSTLLRPSASWEDRFKQFSCYSKEESPYKWDFIW
jgi:transposase